jgi:hypothetical protein
MATAACGPRQVEVQTGAAPAAESRLNVTNNLTQAANIYVVHNGTPAFQARVDARSTMVIDVRSAPAGSTVTLRAAPVNGGSNYEKSGVVLGGTYSWIFP